MKKGENLLEKQIRNLGPNVPPLARAIYTPGELSRAIYTQEKLAAEGANTPLNAALLWCLSDRSSMYDPLIDSCNPRPIALLATPQDKGANMGPGWGAVPRTTTKLPTSKPL